MHQLIDKKNKIIYIQECFYETHLTTSQIAHLNQRFAGDSLIVADCAEPRLISELKAKGNNIVPTIKGAGSVTYGIALLQDYDLVIDEEQDYLRIEQLHIILRLHSQQCTYQIAQPSLKKDF